MEHLLCLAALTSRRGLPRNLLEVYLRNLSAEWTRTRASARGGAEPLERVAEELRIQREEILPDDRRRGLIGAFSGQVKTADSTMVGWFVTAAVTDEANGIHGAVPAVLDWLQDIEARTDAWRAAVEDLIVAASHHTVPRGP